MFLPPHETRGPTRKGRSAGLNLCPRGSVLWELSASPSTLSVHAPLIWVPSAAEHYPPPAPSVPHTASCKLGCLMRMPDEARATGADEARVGDLVVVMGVRECSQSSGSSTKGVWEVVRMPSRPSREPTYPYGNTWAPKASFS